jgi:EmrB/QacA subfamily drug resistance transporter
MPVSRNTGARATWMICATASGGEVGFMLPSILSAPEFVGPGRCLSHADVSHIIGGHVINPRARPCAEGTIRSTSPIAGLALSEKTWTLVAGILGSSTAFIDESVVNVALPAIETQLGASVAVVQWVINAYTLCVAALLLIGGAAGDRFGRRRIFITGIGIFAVASIWCGFAQNIPQLIAARSVQGIGAALLIPCSLALIGASFDETERGRAIGTWSGFTALAGAIAPILGGFIVDHASWRTIFFINPFLALPAALIALRFVPESRDRDAPKTLDWLGTLLVFAGLGMLVAGLIWAPGLGWGDPIVIGLLSGGTVLLLAFVGQQTRTSAPLIPPSLSWRSRDFTGVNLLTFLLYGALGGAFFLLPFDLIQVHGYSATQAGLAFLPFTVILGALSRWSGGLLDRFGARLPLVVGPIVAALGFTLLALPGTGGSYWTTFFWPMAVLGFGMAISVAPLTATVLNAVDKHHIGVASGINDAVATVASLLAVAVFGIAALTISDAALNRQLSSVQITTQVRSAIESAKGKFIVEPKLAESQNTDQQIAAEAIRQSLAAGIRASMLLAAMLAAAGALLAALIISPKSGSARIMSAELGQKQPSSDLRNR